MWTLIPPITADAATQMAIDTVLLDRCEANPDSGFLRFYRMRPAAVTIGRHQRWRRVIDPAACEARGWGWVRRPTGGGALLHANEVNYAIAAGHRLLNRRGLSGFRSVFEWIVSGLAASIAELGLNPVVSTGSREPTAPQVPANTRQHGLCGRSLTRYEIAEGGRKLLASAQLLTRNGALQHGTVYMSAPLESDRFWPNSLSASAIRSTRDAGTPSSPQENALPRGAPAEAAQQRWTDLRQAVGDLTWEQIATRLAVGLIAALAVEPIESHLSAGDLRAVEAIRGIWQLQGWHTRR